MAMSFGAMLAAQTAANYFSDKLNETEPDYTAMQNRIQWTVNDANKAGISPLAALGAPTVQPGETLGKASVKNALGRAIPDAYSKLAMDQSRKTAIKEANARIESESAQQAKDYALAQKTLMETQAMQREMDASPSKTLPLFDKYYDNRTELGPLKPGQHYLTTQEVAQALESFGAAGISASGNVMQQHKKLPQYSHYQILKQLYKAYLKKVFQKYQ